MSYFRMGRPICLLLVAMAVILPLAGLAEDSVGDAPPSDAPPTDAPPSDDSSGDGTGDADATGDETGDADAPGGETGDAGTTGNETGDVSATGDVTGDLGAIGNETGDVGATGNETGDVGATGDETGDVGATGNETGDVGATTGNETGDVGEITPELPLDEEEVEEEIELSETDRIWREGKNPDTYTWTPQTFSGFFYDLDEGIGTEKLTVHLKKSGDEYDRSIDEGDLVYETNASDIEFEFGDWGVYQVIGFMAEKFFAGYVGTVVADDEVSLLDEEELRRVLIDSDDEYTVTTGSVLPLEEGCELRIKEIDLDGNKVWFSLAQDGDEVDSRVITPGDIDDSTYKYEVDLSGDDLPLVMAHISNVFSGAETSLVTVDGLFQISDTHNSIESGDEYGDMEIDSVSGKRIIMENDNSITLRKGKKVPVMGDISFLVADNNTLRFAPVVKRTGSYEIRGTMVDPDEVDRFTWTPYNFEGFYYDIDDDVGTERLTARFSGTKIDDGDLEYETVPDSVEFEYSRWGDYDVIGFLAEKYFAGYNDDTEFTDDFSVISEEELRKVLIDDDESYTVRSGAMFPLEEGYELRIKEVDLDGNKVFLAITKDGDEVGNKVVEPGRSVKDSTFVYEEEIGGEDVPIIAAHIQSVFRGREEDLATVEGIFQISDDPAGVKEGESYGKMEIESVSDDGITMENDGSFSLGRGKTISIMENLKFKVGDERRLVVPVVEVREEALKPLTLKIAEAVVGGTVRIEVASKGEPVSGVHITVDGEEVSTTDGDGVAIYLPKIAGSFEIEAKKSDYTDAKDIIVVREIKEERVLAISVPPEVMKGEEFVTKITIGLVKRPVADAEVFFDEVKVGLCDNQGTVSYSSDAVGRHTIKARKEGYEENTKEIVVLTPINLASLEMDETAKAGKKIKIKANLENIGTVDDIRPVDLKVNGVTVETKNVTVGPGESESVIFEYAVPEEVGVYTVEVDGVQRALTVEEKTSDWWIVAILLLIFVIGGVAYLYSTGRMDEQVESIRGSLKK
ncbi:MAG: S-layer protein domain-containing protein [Methanotrichaceae archaeon]